MFLTSLCVIIKLIRAIFSMGGERNEKIHAVETAEFSFLWHAS